MIDIDDLVAKYGTQFKKFRDEGKSVYECGKLLGIAEKPTSALNKFYGIKRLQKWKQLQIPENFSQNTKSLIYGTLLGDSSIHISGFDSCHKSFTLSHGPKQKDYLEHKINLLSEIKPYPVRDTHDKWGTLSTRTAPHPEFDKIYNQFYINGVKEVSLDILNQLTPEAIALWFMDDGCSRKYGFHIATCAFNIQSLQNIKSYFENTHDIKIGIVVSKYLRVSINGINAIKFRGLIEKYIIDSLKYKIYLSPGTGKGSGWRP